MKKMISALLFSSISMGAAATAMAQTDPGSTGSGAETETTGLGEIIVTARKREETLQSVPVAVAAVSAEQLKNNLASDLSKMGELAPQVNVGQGGAGTGGVITIRGVSSASSDSGIDQSVAIEIDDVPISRGWVMTAAMFDLAGVQVLQGPQALFFGKNSPAGVISIRSADPTDVLSGYVTAGYEFTADEKFIEGAISGPLSDTLKARLAFRGERTKGWIKNIAEPVQDFIDPTVTIPGRDTARAPKGHNYAGRLTLQWNPTSDFEAKLKFLLNEKTTNGASATSEPFCINGVTQPIIAGFLPLPSADCKKDRVKAQAGVPAVYAANIPYSNGGKPFLKSKIALGSLTLEKQFDNFTLNSTTGYFHQVLKSMYTTDWSSYSTIWASTKDDYELFTQELRATTDFDGPFNLMVGGYFETFNRPYFNQPDLFHTFNPAANSYTTVLTYSKMTGDYFSAFAQAQWEIVPTVELSGGARWSHDKKKFRMVNESPNLPGLYPDGVVLRSRYSDDHVSPEVTLSWHPTPDQTLYAAYKTGYKGGGISNGFLVFANATSDSLVFQPEKAEGFEVGYKATMFNRRLRFDLTAYRYNYDNLQVSAYDVETITFSIQNAASARIKGIQGSAEFLATDNLTLRTNFGLNSAKYRKFDTAACYFGQTAAQGCNTVIGTQDLSGKRLLRAPKLTFSFGGDYKLYTGSWLTTLSAQATHSSAYETASDYAPGGHQDDYWLLNAGIRTGPEEGPYELALIGRNLTNSYYLVETFGWSGSLNPDQYVGYFNRPREVVLQATLRF